MNIEPIMRQRLAALQPVSLEVLDESEKHHGHAGWKPGGNTHWSVTIVAEAFRGKSTVARHRMVYQALSELMDNPIHALTIAARAPDERGA